MSSVVIIDCHRFHLFLYLGTARPLPLPHHVHESEFVNLCARTRDPGQLAKILEAVDDAPFA